jgi:catechol 2,3-dioxygenase-like lactoylglutathione lyase family enzyme
MISRVDFVGVPSRDPDRARAFYQETLGLQPDPNAQYESWAGGTCFAPSLSPRA